jgi:hypothetical protein
MSVSHVLSQDSDWTTHGDNFAFVSNTAVISIRFSTPLFVSLTTERKSEDVMAVGAVMGQNVTPACHHCFCITGVYKILTETQLARFNDADSHSDSLT